MMNLMKSMAGKLLVAGLFILCAAGVAVSEEYQIGPEDALEISFWQDPLLNTVVRVSLDGKITLDIIGQIEAEGKTTEELQNDIVRMMSRLNKNISQSVVRVVQFNYNHLYVTGEVTAPGKLTFEKIPDLWSIINEAGGVSETADLSRVTIIRGGKDAGKVEIVNVREAIANGTLERLPKIRRMDTIEIPMTLLGLPTGNLGQPAERRNVVYVVGAVVTPGPIPYEENVDVLEAVAMAGGPSPSADLKKAKIITKDGYYAQSMSIDLKKYSETGKPARYTVRREDTILIPEEGGGLFGASLTTVVSVLGIVTSAILVYDYLNDGTTTSP